MPRIMKNRRTKAGQAPGSLVRGEGSAGRESRITVIRYNENQYQETELNYAGDFELPSRDDSVVTWIDVEGSPDTGVLEKIGDHYKIHSLVLEDIISTDDRPKIEDYGDYVFITLKIIGYNKALQEIDIDHASIILGQGYVTSFREKKDNLLFKPIRERINGGQGRLRKKGPDYLVYSIVDLIVDHYFDALESLGDMIDNLEEMFIVNSSQFTLSTFHKLKREVLFLRKSVWPLREVISVMDRGELKLFDESLRLYLRDVYDHVTQIIDIVETFRDMLSEMLDIYMSSISNRINEVMKVLTIITTIFIPLSFLAGVYGMNFKYMPELEWRWGYPLTLAVMGVVGLIMVSYFRKKKWL